MHTQLNERLNEYYQKMVDIRRYLHQHPELSFEEVHTPAYIRDFHEKLGLEVNENVGSRGVTAILHGSHPGPTIALRADFDALPIHDEKEVSYRSTIDGKMHACGHDGHTATLLVLAEQLHAMKDELHGSVKFIHQHAEEYAPGGAIEMIQDGCLEGVDAIFGTHLWATAPTGIIQTKSGPFMAASDRFEVTIQGQGGHGAMPHLTKDAVLIGSQLVVNLQSIISRMVDPQKSGVVSVGNFTAENTFNVIADQAYLLGTARSFDEETRTTIENAIQETAEHTCRMSGAEAKVSYVRGYPAVVNHEKETETAAAAAAKVPEVHAVEAREPVMGGEDFAHYLENIPGTFFFTGAQHPDWETTYPHHHPKFDIDEKAMLIAAKTLGQSVLDYMDDYR
ncbi:amidohydrolase [Salsuginibacillus halophilus]|uniref:Amidohydrolase n=1 Tax=Salsuginibacillus halophilus TaxID=517424 RepID=A0A2P8HFZ7_9BACI|nr:amidohydrolase [Salsuginibacillus halophilus]PSL45148.1 amidohydrolase [Salsuginibacillus halophilus]